MDGAQLSDFTDPITDKRSLEAVDKGQMWENGREDYIFRWLKD